MDFSTHFSGEGYLGMTIAIMQPLIMDEGSMVDLLSNFLGHPSTWRMGSHFVSSLDHPPFISHEVWPFGKEITTSV